MQGVQTSLHLSHSQQMIPRLDKKHHTEETQIFTSFEDSLEELTRLTHSCTCGYGLLEREARKHSQHWDRHMGQSAENTKYKLPRVLAGVVTQMGLIPPAMSCEGTHERGPCGCLFEMQCPKVLLELVT